MQDIIHQPGQPGTSPPPRADLALCAQADPDAWFPEHGFENSIETRTARRICGTCPVRVPCLAYALGRGERHGIWGGLTYAERRELARGTERAA